MFNIFLGSTIATCPMQSLYSNFYVEKRCKSNPTETSTQVGAEDPPNLTKYNKKYVLITNFNITVYIHFKLLLKFFIKMKFY